MRVKCIVQKLSTMSLAGLKPGLFDPGADALTMRPSRIADILEKEILIVTSDASMRCPKHVVYG